MTTHREALDAATAAAVAARRAAIEAGYTPDSAEVERSGWKAADEVLRRLRPQDYMVEPAPLPPSPPDDPIFERMNR
ncbi:hypothetical protein QDA01_gp51 [Microbacterium phage Cinna]|uniref:Uncharacterized protein n=2 Tax=Mementomorivirus TaxID=2733194 RepID=A0A2Z4Q6B4_9CAUD|nr:hypothetical protein HOT41_gp54 [Microbacterium phage MementoMori]YP_010751061.1 hypothetical protein QDA01_gp51 [Microbacterium phage Cinna]AWY05309.1 hypothetical protein SEA_MEMENTOMORI_55 [Microbacterium phage MementoMori]QDH91638.1 hypothetical protein PBI_CINNA_54 [Microbacterium phage Cinna]